MSKMEARSGTSSKAVATLDAPQDNHGDSVYASL